MDKLVLLAQRIDGLIQELTKLRDENAKLKAEVKNLSDELELGKLEAEELQKKIEAGTSAHNDICIRVDDLIGRIQAILPAEAAVQEGFQGQVSAAPSE